MKTNPHFLSSPVRFSLEGEMLNCIENKIHTFYIQKLRFWKSCGLWDNVQKYGRAGQATDDNYAKHAFSMLDT
jgi:hypothetical protein